VGREKHVRVRVEPVSFRQGFGIGDVERCTPHSTLIESTTQGILVNQATSSNVHEVDPGFHLTEDVIIDEVVGLGR